MSTRSLARSIVLQTLFEWDFYNRHAIENKKTVNLADLLEKNIKEFGEGMDNPDFTFRLTQGVIENKENLDKIITDTAPEWPIDQINLIDKNILRMSLYELLFGNYEEVPPKVAINEAIEIAKNFGGETSGKFINGVLGTVYREIGEPGKDFQKENFAKIICAGGIIYRKESEIYKIALILDRFGYWTLPKGEIEPDENIEIAAQREITEEIGINNLELISKIGEVKYFAAPSEVKPASIKTVHYFLFKTEQSELTLSQSPGITDGKWFSPDEIKDLKKYQDIENIIEKAKEIILK